MHHEILAITFFGATVEMHNDSIFFFLSLLLFTGQFGNERLITFLLHATIFSLHESVYE